MFGGKSSRNDAEAVLGALGRSLAIIEFDPNGTILTANETFCAAMGYALAEIKGQHHRMFVDPTEAAGDEYKAFWAKLARGEFDAREYRRLGKGGREVWIQASYNPVTDSKGRVVKVVKAATDITAAKLRNAEFEGKINAISRAQAVIEFTPSGEILTANANFLSALGYSLSEIQGQHHRMFVEPDEVRGEDYRAFWVKLNRGEFVAAEFKRIGKGGKEVWINASYNPIFDMNGLVMKVVKFATDITARVKAVNAIGEGLSQLAENNLAHRLNETFDPAFEQVRDDFNRSLEKLQGAMARVGESASSIQAGTQQISAASNDLSRRTEQQAASLEETAAALDQITATVKQSADSAKQANLTASDAKTNAVRSGEVVKNAIVAMSQIEDSSNKITQIIGVIDEIAFQTNLLALNAGVEAARAGEAGKGFAVVASEVRGLAQRSAEAAKEIKSLIASSSEQVKSGVRLVGETGRALTGIVSSVTEIDDLIAQIAQSSQEQSLSLSQVNTAVNQMDQVTQQNAAMVEEATATAMELKSEADKMSQLMGQFELGQIRVQGFEKPRLAQANDRAFAPNPVAKAQAGLVSALIGGGAQPAQDWEEF